MTTDSMNLDPVTCLQSGCGWTGSLLSRHVHLKTCPYVPQVPIPISFPVMHPPVHDIPNMKVESTIHSLYRYKIDCTYPTGWVNRFGDERTTTRFFHYLDNDMTRQFVFDSARITNTVKTKYLLSIRDVDVFHDRIIVCHEDFETFLHPWLSLNPHKKELFHSDGMLTEFWRGSIKNILQTLQMLHENNMAHGNLDIFESFAIRKEEIYLLLPSKDGSEGKMGGDALDEVNEKDLQCVKNLLLANVTVTVGEEGLGDWDNFLAMFESGITAEKLRGHPVLMNPSERAGFMSAICDHLGFANASSYNATKMEFSKVAESYCRNGGWDKAVHGRTIPKLVYDYKSPVVFEDDPKDDDPKDHHVVFKYDPNNKYHMFKFVKNYIHHAGSEARDKSVPFSKKEAGLELSHMFPGYMSCIYKTLVTKFPKLNIWVKE